MLKKRLASLALITAFFATCGSPSVEPVEASVWQSVDETDAVLPVWIEGGHQLETAKATNRAARGDQVGVELRMRWGSEPIPDQLELALWRAGAGEPSFSGSWHLDSARAGELQEARFELTVPEEMKSGRYWWMLSFKDEKLEKIDIPSFPGDMAVLGLLVLFDPGMNEAPTPIPAPALGADVERIRLVVGGDVNLGRRQNGISGNRGSKDALGALTLLKNADLSYVNLESVLSDVGDVGVNKGEQAPFYYRGRPEQANVLTEAGIDLVGAANNHSGDYGPVALKRQTELLRSAGVLQVGAGANLEAACGPRLLRVGTLAVAFVTVDMTQPRFHATADAWGSCGVVVADGVKKGLGVLSRSLRRARASADVVVVGVHWGNNNKSRPGMPQREFARWLVGHGVDAVVGSSAHRLQGVEILQGRPVLYDTGNLLFDSHLDGESSRSALFELELTAKGVHSIQIHPVDVDYGRAKPASGNSASRTLRRFTVLSAELGTPVEIEDGVGRIGLPYVRDRSAPQALTIPEKPVGVPVEPLVSPPDGCVVESVPSELALDAPVPIGPFELLGVGLTPRTLDKRGLVWMESYWRVRTPIADHWVATRLVAEDLEPSKMWWADHELCDWLWPSSRWTPGQIYRDVYSLRPPRKLPAGRYQLVMAAMQEGEDPSGFAWRGPTVEVK